MHGPLNVKFREDVHKTGGVFEVVNGTRKIKNSSLEIMFRAIKPVFTLIWCLESVQFGVPVWMCFVPPN